jgi:hypothetical protein
MHSPETYSWQTPYVAAILERDEDQLHTLLYQTIAAIEQRRLSPVNSEEDSALTAAEAGLQILISERIQKIA